MKDKEKTVKPSDAKSLANNVILTKPEAAELLRISPRTLDTARVERGLPYIQLPGCRKILFDRQQLLSWVESNTVNSPTEETTVVEK